MYQLYENDRLSMDELAFNPNYKETAALYKNKRYYWPFLIQNPFFSDWDVKKNSKRL